LSIRRIDIHWGVRVGIATAAAVATFVAGSVLVAPPVHAQANYKLASMSDMLPVRAAALCGGSQQATGQKPSVGLDAWLKAERRLPFADGTPAVPSVKLASTSSPKARCILLSTVPKPAPAPAPKATPRPVPAKATPAPQPAQTSTSSQGGTQSSYVGGEPCHSSVFYVGAISQWKVPPGCYAGIYAVNPSNYVYRPGFGWCNWWPEVLHPNQPGILSAPRHSVPVPGAAVFFEPGVQGADPSGHYAEVVAVLPQGWVLISEMNDTWRGGGWGRVNYRYIHTGYGVWFLYY
jgi:hypothetical protein